IEEGPAHQYALGRGDDIEVSGSIEHGHPRKHGPRWGKRERVGGSPTAALSQSSHEVNIQREVLLHPRDRLVDLRNVGPTRFVSPTARATFRGPDAESGFFQRDPT